MARVSPPVAVKDLFENDAIAKIGDAQQQEAPKIQFHCPLAAPAAQKASDEQNAEYQPGQQGNPELVGEMLFDKIIDKGRT